MLLAALASIPALPATRTAIQPWVVAGDPGKVNVNG